MHISSGKFANPQEHHEGWFKFYRFGGRNYEIWFGSTYWTITL